MDWNGRAVDKCCGKTCGDCGKLLVFNRYFRGLQQGSRMWKSVHSGLHNSGKTQPDGKLRYRGKEGVSNQKETKMFGYW